MDFKSYLSLRQKYINESLNEFMLPENTRPEIIHKAMHHSLFAGGKRLRPIMVLEANLLAGGQDEDAIKAACAIECLHTATLIHDDLPCMDDDDFRRGIPTCHKVYGEDMAVLAGVSLLAFCFELAAKPLSIPFQKQLQVIAELSEALGATGVIAGQVEDILSEGQKGTIEQLEYIHKHKTARLLIASLKIGAIIGGADEEMLQDLSDFGEAFGLAFQITDDILDISGTAEELGKPIGSDLKLEKLTYPSLVGLEQAEKMAAEQIEKCNYILAKYGEKSMFFRNMADYLLTRTS